MNSRAYAIGLSLLALCGCVPTPVQVVCQVPSPPPVLMVEPPPPMSFTDRLTKILTSGQTSTNSQPTPTK